jgi:uncharacterized Zn-binding protein involved in type VI secretion
MGMPACTITSQTAHGGIVTVGFPQVLINFLPASRIGDLHVCPMVDGVVPHVGGPFVLGSFTVLVGMMPQSRVTDELVCVGPPDVAVMGVETVLVGMVGSMGAMGAMGGIAALGVAVPTIAPSSNSNAQSVLQYDGTTNTSTAASTLPPVPLTQKGWPDLSPENTATFQSVQPVTLPQGTQLFAAADSQSGAIPNFWSTTPPASTDPSKDIMKVLTVTDPAGMKAWAGVTPSQVSQYSARAQQIMQQAAAQARQQAQQAAAQAQQNFNQAQQQAQQQVQQQAQQTMQQARLQAQHAAYQASAQAQQIMQQAGQAASLAQKSAVQAGQQAAQVCTSGSSTAKQSIQNFAPPKIG